MQLHLNLNKNLSYNYKIQKQMFVGANKYLDLHVPHTDKIFKRMYSFAIYIKKTIHTIHIS